MDMMSVPYVGCGSAARAPGRHMATLDLEYWPDPTPVFYPYSSSQPQLPLRSPGPEVRGEIDADRDAPFEGLNAISEGVYPEEKAAQQEGVCLR